MLKKLKKNKKGFTLAELLIVVAIIGVLVAISIPIFTRQLEKSRDAVSIANIRAAYAQAQTAVLANTKTGTASADTTDGDVTFKSGYDFGAMTGTVVVNKVAFKGTDGSDKFSGLAAQLPFNDVTDFDKEPSANDNGTVTFTYVKGVITAVAYA